MGKVVHFEIPADDRARASAWYAKIFGWRSVAMPEMNYVVVHSGPTDDSSGMAKEAGFINGGIVERKDIKSPVVVMNVASVDETVKAAEGAGSKVIRPKVVVGNMGYIAYITDSENNIVGVWENMKK